VLTLPKKPCENCKLKSGDKVPLINLDGIFVISQLNSEVERLAGEISSALAERGGNWKVC